MPKPMPVEHMQNTGHHWLDGAEPAVPYQHQEFPKRMHHPRKSPVVVNNADEQRKLGGEWSETPATFDTPVAGGAPAPPADPPDPPKK